MKLAFEVYGKIKKPIEEVFDAVYNPRKLSGYFTTGGAIAPLNEGATVHGTFMTFQVPFQCMLYKW